MQFEREIERAVRHQVAIDTQTAKSTEEINLIVKAVKNSLQNSNYDFSNSKSILLNQNGKRRFVKSYPDLYSSESVLCQCVKQILDRTFKVKYPNRNRVVKSLFSILSAVKQMSDFTIVKFDFKDYFNSVSTIYLFEKFLKPKLLNRFEADLVKNFAYKTNYAYAGFSTSNAMAEIIARHFDDVIRLALAQKGILFYERYIDDSVLILNEYVEESEIKCILDTALSSVFCDDSLSIAAKCKTKFNSGKFRYISRRLLSMQTKSFDYLGYEFNFSLIDKNDVEILYGITKDKRVKYERRIDKIIACYTEPKCSDFGNLELLRHRIAAFSSREVYLTKRFRSNIWKVKGFISNYGELRYLLETDLVDSETELFLKNMIRTAFSRAGIAEPYFLKGSQGTSGYNLFENMKSNKTILLVDHIGYDYNSLVTLCKQIGISNLDSQGKRRGYGALVRDYLIKVKVGY